MRAERETGDSAIKAMRPNFEATGYVTAFVDLLGVSARFLSFNEACMKDPNGPRCHEAARHAYGPIEMFREVFRNFYERHNHPKEPVGFMQASREARGLFHESVAQKAVIQAASDCILISVRFDLEQEISLWRGLMGLTAALSGAQFFLLSLGVLCRGGIALGMSCEPYEGEVLGASVAKAVALEKEASLPMIVIDPAFLQALTEATRRPITTPRTRAAHAMTNEILGQFVTKQETTFLDYAGASTIETMRSTCAKDWDEFIVRVRRHLDSGGLSGDESIRRKYEWTASYLESRLRE